MGHPRRALNASVVMLGLLPSCLSISIAQQPGRSKAATPAGTSNANMVRGRHDYETRCSGCHGLDGRGGERAPNISTDPAIQKLPDRDIFRMVHDGNPSQGMPAFDYITDGQIKSMVGYFRFMGRQSGREFVNGNSLQGEKLFFGKAGCGNCHMMDGKGVFLSTDLTEYAGTHTPGSASIPWTHSRKAVRAGERASHEQTGPAVKPRPATLHQIRPNCSTAFRIDLNFSMVPYMECSLKSICPASSITAFARARGTTTTPSASATTMS